MLPNNKTNKDEHTLETNIQNLHINQIIYFKGYNDTYNTQENINLLLTKYKKYIKDREKIQTRGWNNITKSPNTNTRIFR